jgi:Tfp pilus assembly protein PilO
MKKFDFKKLNEIDVKDVNWTALKEKFLERKELLVMVGCIVVTLFLLMSTVGKRIDESKDLKSRIVSMEEKIGFIKEHDAVKDAIAKYVRNFPETIAEDKMISMLTDLAVKYGVTINSFSPGTRVEEGLYSRTSIQLNLSTKDYRNVVFMVGEIENDPRAIRIDQLTFETGGGTRSRRYARQGEEEKEDVVSVTMTISAIKLNENARND